MTNARFILILIDVGPPVCRQGGKRGGSEIEQMLFFRHVLKNHNKQIGRIFLKFGGIPDGFAKVRICIDFLWF